MVCNNCGLESPGKTCIWCKENNDRLYISGYSKSKCPYCGRDTDIKVEKICNRVEGYKNRDFFGIVYCEPEAGGCGGHYAVKKVFRVSVKTVVVEIPSERKEGEGEK